jgi:hypothetical protein
MVKYGSLKAKVSKWTLENSVSSDCSDKWKTELIYVFKEEEKAYIEAF